MNMVLALILYALSSLFLPGANASPAYARFTAATGEQEAFGATYMQEGKGRVQWLGRNLLQSDTTPVTTAAQLQNAVSAGVRHIVVQQHMDLSSLQLSEQESVLGFAVDTTVSITGDCAAKPGPAMSTVTGPALLPLLPRQCLVITDASLLDMNSGLWMDNIYIRLERTTRTPLNPVLLSSGEESPGLHLTGITLQGDGVLKRTGSPEVLSCGGLSAASRVYMQGCTLSHLGGNTTTLRAEVPIAIVNSTIVDNAQLQDDVPILDLNFEQAAAWLRGVTFARNTAAQLVVAYTDTRVFSDTALEYYDRADGEYVTATTSPAASTKFLSPQVWPFGAWTEEVAREPASVPAQAVGDLDAVTKVATPEELQQAVMEGVRHIEVIAHMDLTSLNEAFYPDGFLLGVFSDATRSIRGNCAEAPRLYLDGPPVLPLLPGQCILVADMEIAYLSYGQLWMHNLYLRHAATARAGEVSLVVATQESGRLWLTLTTLQGAGKYADGAGATGLDTASATYILGCQFTNLGGSRNVLYVNTASVRIVNSTFSNNIIPGEKSAIIYTNGATWLEGTAFVNNSAVQPLAVGRSVSSGVASDVPREIHLDYEILDTTEFPDDVSAFLNGDESWFQDVLAVFPSASISSEAAEDPTTVTVVKTAEQLHAAVTGAARHIELQSHLNLLSLHITDNSLLGDVFSATRTLRGNCSSTPVDEEALQLTGARLRPLSEGQCIIVADNEVLRVMKGRVWVDNVYFRLTTYPWLLRVGGGGQLWLTRSTLQGSGSYEAEQSSTALFTDSFGKVFAQGVVFADLGGSNEAVSVDTDSAVRFVDCTFADNDVNGSMDGVILAQETSYVWLQWCHFVNNTAAHELAAWDSATFYNDGPEKYYSRINETKMQPQSAPPAEKFSNFLALPHNFVTVAAGELGLQVSLEQAEPAAPGAQAAAPTLIVAEAPPTVTVPPVAPEPTGGNTTSADAPRDIGMGIDGEVNSTPQQGSPPVAPTGKKTNWAAVGAGVAAVIVLLLLGTACFLIARRRRYRLNGKTMAYGFGGVHTAKPEGKSDHAALFHKDRNRSKRYGVAASNANRPSHTGLTTTAWDAVSAGVYSNITTSVATATTAYNTSVSAGETSFEQQKERLKTELDHMRRRSENFLRQYAVMPWTERREGGQGVVQFMRSARTEEAVAVKFFLSRKAFDAELELYQVDVLRSMMPAIRLELNNADGTERNSRGYPWPPCIVIEKGESLQEWKAKTKPAFSTVVDALCLITERLAQLHGSGWVHRDLKPGNILRLPSQHSWTLMDFGCAARAGASVPITFSPAYAPPEVALALESKNGVITAHGAADIWALGIMAFELLTNEPVFPPFVSTRETIWAQLCGREVLPWEDGAGQQADKLSQLRGLKQAILQCLKRQPTERPTAEQVLTQWRTLFDSRTATG